MRLDEISKQLPETVLKAFLKLGDDQRGRPEAAMLKVQFAMGGGVLNPVVEHVGDLTHRMTELLKYGSENNGRSLVIEKCKKGIRYLDDSYGFERELEQNIANNAAYRKIPVEEFKQKLSATLKRYAEEHSKLVVYNKVQWLAREAAIQLGLQNWKKASQCLHELLDIAQSNQYDEAAIAYTLDSIGNPLPFRYSINEALKPGNKEEIKIAVNKLTGKQKRLIDKVAVLDEKLQELQLKYPASLLKDENISEKIKEIEEYLEREKEKTQKEIDNIKTEINTLRNENNKVFYQFIEDTIIPQCSDFIKSMKKADSFLYRGTTTDKVLFKGKPREDRRPKDSSDIGQKAFDLLLKSKGYTALRSNSIFTTTDIHKALSFGDIFVIFPINGFSYTWINDNDVVIEDIPVKMTAFKKVLTQLKPLLIKIYSERYKGKSSKREIIGMVKDTLQEYSNEFQYGSAEDTIDDLNKDYRLNLDINDFIDLKQLNSKYKPTNSKLEDAMVRQYEILINGEYYALNLTKYGKLLSEYFNIQINEDYL